MYIERHPSDNLIFLWCVQCEDLKSSGTTSEDVIEKSWATPQGQCFRQPAEKLSCMLAHQGSHLIIWFWKEKEWDQVGYSEVSRSSNAQDQIHRFIGNPTSRKNSKKSLASIFSRIPSFFFIQMESFPRANILEAWHIY